jgi:hypothetical protein
MDIGIWPFRNVPGCSRTAPAAKTAPTHPGGPGGQGGPLVPRNGPPGVPYAWQGLLDEALEAAVHRRVGAFTATFPAPAWSVRIGGVSRRGGTTPGSAAPRCAGC